jgi:hypothetical protein
MIRIDHISMSVRNVFEAAHQLREETGLGFYDGGWTIGGIASRIFPLGGNCYLLMEGIVDATALSKQSSGPLRLFHDQVSKGDCFRGFTMATDTMAELEQEAARLKLPVTQPNPNGGRMMLNGDKVLAAGLGGVGELWSKGLPNYNFFVDMTTHPSGHPVIVAPELVKPLGLAEVEVGGPEKELGDWLGMPPSSLKFKFDGKGPGVRSISVQTDRGPIRISRRSVNDA